VANQDVLITNSSLGEEIVNSITHGIGALLSVAGLTLLLVSTTIDPDPCRIASCIVYGTSLIILFLASTLYHSFTHTPTKMVFRLIDHCAIYLLIAGTYTPYLLISIGGTQGWVMFSFIWVLAILGIAFQVASKHRFRKTSLFTYLFMGWSILLFSTDLFRTLPEIGFLLLVGGGVIYTVGAAFYAIKRIPYNHAIWHLFVLGGSTCHFISIYFYVLPLA